LSWAFPDGARVTAYQEIDCVSPSSAPNPKIAHPWEIHRELRVGDYREAVLIALAISPQLPK
jgi:hypothetical protein